MPTCQDGCDDTTRRWQCEETARSDAVGAKARPRRAAALENGLTVSQKSKTQLPCDSAFAFRGIYLREMEIVVVQTAARKCVQQLDR